MKEIRKLSEGDREDVEALLIRHADTSMFIRSNLRQKGFHYQGQALEGEYFGRFVEGRLTDVVGHVWNGTLLLQTPSLDEDLVRQAVSQSGRDVTGLIGPWPQVERALKSLAMDANEAKFNSCEDFFVLELEAFEYLLSPPLEASLARKDEYALLASWSRAFNQELVGRDLSEAEAKASVERHASHLYVLRRDGVPVSQALFNAELPDCVQVGGVYTPPEERRRGYARAAVAGALLAAKARGVSRAVLFTQKDNVSAQNAYHALGFRRIGDFGLVLFA